LDGARKDEAMHVEYWMASWLWLLPPVIGLAIWKWRQTQRGVNLGSMSPQWLHEYRHTHHEA
jgi:hypothetical protein